MTHTNHLLPAEFIELISKSLPAHLSIDDLVHYCQQPLRFSIRVNSLKISHDNFMSLMKPLGWQFSPVDWCVDGYWVELAEDATAPGKLPEHLAGLFYIQEASSMLPPTALFENIDKTPQHVLDLAAAPGSKTTQIATLMSNKGLLVANEFSSSRVKALHANLQRLGISNTLISHFDGSVHGDYLENQFDAILLDAPCSGEGTVRKDSDAFKNWSLAHLEEVTALQKSLIRSAFMALKPGGELVYSTCALNGLENQGVCQWLLEEFADNAKVVSLNGLFDGAEKSATNEGFLHIWPQIYNSEGFFVAKFTKTSATACSNEPSFKSKFPFSLLSKKQSAAIIELLAPMMNTSDFTDNLMSRQDEVWYFPVGCETLTNKMRFARHGVKLIELGKKHNVINHDAICIWGKVDVELTREQYQLFLRGQDIAIDNPNKNKGEVVLGYAGTAIGLGKWVNNKIKNKLPRHLVSDHVQL
ncbi:MAG: 16S rRNA (cytosine(1407)-C(5))-methyltransferase RsmF [Psychrobium sp.]